MPLSVLSVSYSLAHVSRRTAGGAEQVLATIDEALIREGHRSLVLAPAGSRCEGLLIPAHVPTGILDEEAKREARAIFKKLINRALNDHAVDVVHMHGLDFYHYLPQCDLPIVVTLHLPLSWYGLEALRPVQENVTLVCVSEAQAQTAPPDLRIDAVITNGVDLSRFHPRRKKSNYVLAIARICAEKGIHLAIDAAEDAGIDLLIAGSVFGYAEHLDYFESMIRPRLNERVRFVGLVGGERKANLLAGARCLLTPCLAPETSSLVAMEALASGTPVIAFPSGALSEIVVTDKTGFLVNSVEEMANAIREVDCLSPVECRREAEGRFSSERMVAQYLDLYRSVLTSKALSQVEAA